MGSDHCRVEQQCKPRDSPSAYRADELEPVGVGLVEVRADRTILLEVELPTRHMGRGVGEHRGAGQTRPKGVQEGWMGVSKKGELVKASMLLITQQVCKRYSCW